MSSVNQAELSVAACNSLELSLNALTDVSTPVEPSWKYNRVRVLMRLCNPNRFQTAINNLSKLLRRESEYTFLKMEEFETEDGKGEWLVSIIWAHHDGEIVETEEHHWSLTGAFYRCADHWLWYKDQVYTGLPPMTSMIEAAVARLEKL